VPEEHGAPHKVGAKVRLGRTRRLRPFRANARNKRERAAEEGQRSLANRQSGELSKEANIGVEMKGQELTSKNSLLLTLSQHGMLNNNIKPASSVC
jgi:hypothetical protein